MENKETKEIVEIKKTKKIGGIGVKLIFISFIIIALLIGLGFIKGQLEKRDNSYYDAKYEISKSAGGELYLEGPYIYVPYKKTKEEVVYKNNNQFKEYTTEEGWLQLSADYINIESNLDSEIRPLGIYSSPVFTGNASILAMFNVELEQSKKSYNSVTEYNFDKAVLFVNIKNSSLKNSPTFNLNDKEYSSVSLCYCPDTFDVVSYLIKDLDKDMEYYDDEIIRVFVEKNVNVELQSVPQYITVTTSFDYNDVFNSIKVRAQNGGSSVSTEGVDIDFGNTFDGFTQEQFNNDEYIKPYVDKLIALYFSVVAPCNLVK